MQNNFSVALELLNFQTWHSPPPHAEAAPAATYWLRELLLPVGLVADALAHHFEGFRHHH
jgi:hypothetical protein